MGRQYPVPCYSLGTRRWKTEVWDYSACLSNGIFQKKGIVTTAPDAQCLAKSPADIALIMQNNRILVNLREDVDILFHFNVMKMTENTNIYLCSPNKRSINKIEFINCLWWRHQMEAFSASLAICVGNSPVPGEFTAQGPVTRSFEASFDVRLNKRLSKQSWGWWFETLSRPLWRHRNVWFLVGFSPPQCHQPFTTNDGCHVVSDCFVPSCNHWLGKRN